MSTDPALNRKHQETWRNKNRDVQRQRNRDQRQKLRTYIAQVKQDSFCIQCGENHPACLDFHHRDPREKDLDIAKIVGHGWGMKRLVAELEKCDILCSNCHRKLHFETRSPTVEAAVL